MPSSSQTPRIRNTGRLWRRRQGDSRCGRSIYIYIYIYRERERERERETLNSSLPPAPQTLLPAFPHTNTHQGAGGDGAAYPIILLYYITHTHTHTHTQIKVLEETERRLEELAPSREAYDHALERASIELEERKLALTQAQGTQERRSVLTTRAITNNSFSINGSGLGGARELTLKEKAERALVDEELEYLIYWADLTQFVRDRWGVIEDGLKNKYTRLFDLNSTKGFCCPEESRDGVCGIHQLIARQEFTRLDGLGNKDGRLQRSELYAEFPPDGNAAFKKGWDWDKAVAYGKEKLLGMWVCVCVCV